MSGSRAPATFTYGGTVSNAEATNLTFINGTAVLTKGGNLTGDTSIVPNFYSTNLFSGVTQVADSVNTTYGITAANGVVVKFGAWSIGNVRVSRSTDGGLSWVTELNTASTGDRLIAGAYGNIGGTARWISPVAGDNDVYLSTNNGDTWTLQSNVLGGTARTWCAATRFGTAFGVFADNVSYYTSEIGTTWTLRTLPVAPGHESFRNFVAGSAEVLYTVNLGGGTISTYTSTDLVNWTTTGTVVFPQPIGEGLLNVAFGNGYYVISAGRDNSIGNDFQYAAYSASAGTNWTISEVQTGTVTGLSTIRDIAYNEADGGFYMIAGSRVWRAITV
jgi:hypothetical protein